MNNRQAKTTFGMFDTLSGVSYFLRKLYHDYIKRAFDCMIALILLINLAPLLLLVAVAIFMEDRGPILFVQKRAGYKKKPFYILKFRSMIVQNDDPTHQVKPGDPRVTWVGNIIRRFKIDELPQLINVLKGEMSLVGPRPTLVPQIPLYTEAQQARYEVMPGLTGWAQVNGNILLSVDERCEHDIHYVQNISPLFDIRILTRTVNIVMLGESHGIKR